MKNTLPENLDRLEEHARYLRESILKAVRDSAPDGWQLALRSVVFLQDVLRDIRSTVRSRSTREKRKWCPHPPERIFRYANGTGKCRCCGQPLKAEP